MHYIEYDESGVGVDHELCWDPDEPAAYYRVDDAKLELTTKWGASETGSKKNPDNAHGLFLIFWATPLVPTEERVMPVQEIGGFWRRGVGIRCGGFVLGIWVPWLRPPRPVLDTPERIDILPSELLEEVA